jgi:hypothetical protein
MLFKTKAYLVTTSPESPDMVKKLKATVENGQFARQHQHTILKDTMINYSAWITVRIRGKCCFESEQRYEVCLNYNLSGYWSVWSLWSDFLVCVFWPLIVLWPDCQAFQMHW